MKCNAEALCGLYDFSQRICIGLGLKASQLHNKLNALVKHTENLISRHEFLRVIVTIANPTKSRL